MRTQRRVRDFVVLSCCLVTALFAAGCGGGGGGSAALPPTPGGAPGATNAPSVPASVNFTVEIPSASTSATTRRPRYVSAGTKSATITYNGTNQTVNCGTSCVATLQVPSGPVTFVAALYDGQNGAGNLLAQGQTQAVISPGAVNSVQITFDGLVATVGLALGSTDVPAGTPASIPIIVTPKDAAGFTIVGSQAFSAPITLSDDDTSGTTSLSTTSISSPGSSTTLTYNGGGSGGTIHVSASVSGTSIASAPVALTIDARRRATPPPTAPPTPAPTPVPVVPPPALVSIAAHVRNLAYYGLDGINASLPASFMAANVDYVEDDGFTAPHADAFKRAGGKTAFAYTDPSFVPHCVAPFAPPAGACAGPIGNLVSSTESAWIHDATGARINRSSGSGQYQESLNLISPAAQQAYTSTTSSILSASPLLDGFFADDSGSNFTASSCSGAGCAFWYGFNSIGVEIASDVTYIAGETAMLAAAGKPVIINGSDNQTQGPAYSGAFINLPYVMGEVSEGCFNNAAGLMTSDGNAWWTRVESGLMQITAYHKLAFCYPTGDTSPAHRLYGYASWLLGYDPTYSVYASIVTQSDGAAIFPETQLVPTQPLQTATAIAQLQKGSVYVREFAQCGIGGVAIGPCAAVVNPSSSTTATIPALTQSYSNQIALDATSLYGGGRARVVAGVPSSLAPSTAAIFVGASSGSAVITPQGRR